MCFSFRFAMKEVFGEGEQDRIGAGCDMNVRSRMQVEEDGFVHVLIRGVSVTYSYASCDATEQRQFCRFRP